MLSDLKEHKAEIIGLWRVHVCASAIYPKMRESKVRNAGYAPVEDNTKAFQRRARAMSRAAEGLRV